MLYRVVELAVTVPDWPKPGIGLAGPVRHGGETDVAGDGRLALDDADRAAMRAAELDGRRDAADDQANINATPLARLPLGANRVGALAKPASRRLSP